MFPVGTLVLLYMDMLDRNNNLREQAKDAFCVKQKSGIYSSRGAFSLYDNSVMYTPDRQQTPIGGAQDLNASLK